VTRSPPYGFAPDGRPSTFGGHAEEVPHGVLEMLRIPGLKPERVSKLYKELGIASVDDLEDAARSGRAKRLKSLQGRNFVPETEAASDLGRSWR
jgi:DNA polymerase/3'-5' exonuclease PolX